MPFLIEDPRGWPPVLVGTVRAVKDVFGWFSHHSVGGVPLDWIVRAVALGLGHCYLSQRMGRRRSMVICVAVLVAKEAFDCFGVLDPMHPRAPDLGDVEDVVSGLLGIGIADVLLRLRTRLPPPPE